MVDKGTLSFYDYDGEPSSYSVNVAELSSANFDAQAALLQTLRTATLGICLVGATSVNIADTIWNTPVVVNDPNAQREIKWVVIVVDASGNKYKGAEIPIANLTLLENNSKYIVRNGTVSVATGAAAVQAWVDAYEAVALSRFGEALIVWDMFQAGRNT